MMFFDDSPWPIVTVNAHHWCVVCEGPMPPGSRGRFGALDDDDMQCLACILRAQSAALDDDRYMARRMREISNPRSPYDTFPDIEEF